MLNTILLKHLLQQEATRRSLWKGASNKARQRCLIKDRLKYNFWLSPLIFGKYCPELAVQGRISISSKNNNI